MSSYTIYKEFGDLIDSLDDKVAIKGFDDLVDPIAKKLKIDQRKFKVYGSSGSGKAAKTPWFGILNYNYYNTAYYGMKLSVSYGIYIVYLLNVEQRKVYLSISYASDITKKYKEYLNEVNELFRSMVDDLEVRNDVLRSIDNRLTTDKSSRSRRYEETSVYAIEYDLNGGKIENERFIDDYKYFEALWFKLFNEMKQKKYIKWMNMWN